MMPALLLLALAQTYDPAQQGQAQHIRPRTFRSEGPARTSRLGQASYAFFEFAPTDGAGMPAVCSTTAPTGAKGEVLTFTRATTATCTKTASGGLATTGIANGDLVSVASGVARVEYDANGVKGLLVEEARTNLCLRSEELDNASWTLDGALTFGAQGTAPDGASTADLLIDNAASFEGVYQTISAAAGTYTCSGYLKGSTSTTPLIQLQDVGGTGTLQQATPSLSTTTWTRQVLTITTAGGTTGFRTFIYPQSTAAAQGNIYAWGWQCEAGAYVTSYIPTTSAGLTRGGDEYPDFPLAWPSTSGFSMASSVFLESGSTPPNNAVLGVVPGDRLPGVATGSAAYAWPFVSAATLAIDATGSASAAASYFPGTPGAASMRVAAYHTGSLLNMCKNGTCAAGTASSWSSPAWQRVRIGRYNAAVNATNGIISRVCVDPDPTRCR